MHAARKSHRQHEQRHVHTTDSSAILPPTSVPYPRPASNHSGSYQDLTPNRRYEGDIVMADAHITAGEFAFTPATQQTTVVTTTTTTVSLPPFVLRPPQDLQQRDPKQYPLAFTATPASMRRFAFEMGNRVATYNEVDSAEQYLQKYQERQRALQTSHGTLVEERSHKMPPQHINKRPGVSAVRAGSIASEDTLQTRRADFPPSLAEAAELASLQRKRKRPRSLLSRSGPIAENEGKRVVQSRQTSTHLGGSLSPVTPDVVNDSTRSLAFGQEHLSTNIDPTASVGQTRKTALATDMREDRGSLAAATPPIQDDDLEPTYGTAPTSEEVGRMLPPGIVASSQQDASLPSPSLSPVTAAANLARSRNVSRMMPDINDDGSDVSGLDIDENSLTQVATSNHSQSSDGSFKTAPNKSFAKIIDPSRSPSLMDVPNMIGMFDAMPAELQSYVMFNLLKRCSKRTLQTVAEVVNPALKCDPFDVLPVELGLQITKFLDGQSLCRAAQVSKRWRQLINSDEKAWKDLLERDGFVLPEGEIERAITEGWGWQFAGPDGYEADLRHKKRSQSTARSEADSASFISADDTSSTRVTRLKRKAASSSSSNKRQKKKSIPPIEENPAWMHALGKAQGPIAYANAAALAVPDPAVGLPSLSNLHLFKSIYQRHHMIRDTWMSGKREPRHLAFRAHHRHVVTCLLFDADRIITGSDDTNINVYDTKTGLLRNKLEGHEGGVWALSCEGDTLVSGSTDRSVRVWDIKTGECRQVFQGHTSTVRCLVILKPTEIGVEIDGSPIVYPEEPVIITGSRDSTLRVWKLPKLSDPSVYQAGPPVNDRDNPYAIRTLSGHHNSVRAIAAYADTLVSGSYDCSVRVWKISTGEMQHRLQGHTQKVYSVVLDHARNRCISGSMDNLVKVWSLDTGVCLFNLEGHTSLVGLLDLSHGQLVSAAADSTLRIWDPDNGQCRNTLSAHTGAITCFQHDGQKVISGSDRTLKMWNVENGECVRDLLTDLSGVWQVRFDERRCVAAVQRNNLTYIEVLDFGASRDGIPAADRGRRVVVDSRGHEVEDDESLAEPLAAAP